MKTNGVITKHVKGILFALKFYVFPRDKNQGDHFEGNSKKTIILIGVLRVLDVLNHVPFRCAHPKVHGTSSALIQVDGALKSFTTWNFDGKTNRQTNDEWSTT